MNEQLAARIAFIGIGEHATESLYPNILSFLSSIWFENAGGHYQRGYWGELSHFARSVLGQVKPIPTLSDAVKTHQLVAAIVRSMESARSVKVDDV